MAAFQLTKGDGSVLAQRFDRSARTVSGTAVPLLSGVAAKDGRPNVAVGPDGTLIYQPATSTLSQLVSVPRLGVETAIDSTMTRAFSGVALSPDGGRLAATVEANDGRSAIWVYDLARHTLVRLTADGEVAFRPEWTPDGSRVLFSSDPAQGRWQARMPPDLASAMVRRGDRAPIIHIEAGSEEKGILDGIALLRTRLDSLRIRYSDTAFVGGHTDRVRERFTHWMLPEVGRWFDRRP